MLQDGGRGHGMFGIITIKHLLDGQQYQENKPRIVKTSRILMVILVAGIITNIIVGVERNIKATKAITRKSLVVDNVASFAVI